MSAPPQGTSGVNITALEAAIPDENAFTVSVLNPGVTGSFSLTLSNPDGNDRTAVVEVVRAASTTETTVRLHDQFTPDPSGGTEETIDNLLLDSGETATEGSMIARTGDSFTSVGTHGFRVLGGGEGANTIGATGEFGRVYLEPARDIVLEAENNASSDARISLTLIWWEAEQVFVGT